MHLNLQILLAYFLYKLSFFLLFRLSVDEVWLAYFKRIHLRRLNHQKRFINLHLVLIFHLFEDKIANFWKLVAASDFRDHVGEFHIDVDLMG